MKHFVVLAVTTILCCSSLQAQNKKENNGFEIKGNIAGLKGKKMILAIRNADDSIRYDTTVVVNGSFYFKGVVDGPTLSALWTVDPEFMNEQFIENKKMTITRKDTSGDVLFLGSAPEEENKLRAKPYRTFYTGLNVINRSMSETIKLDSAGTMKRYKNESDGLMTEFNAGIKKFIGDHPKSIVAAFELSRVAKEWAIPDVQSLYAKMDKSMQQSGYGKVITQSIRARQNTEIGVKAELFIQKNEKGEEVSLRSFRGKYLLIDFWASWCGPCRKENPNVVTAYNKYKTKGFEILGVSLDDNADKWKEAIEKDGLTWPQVSDLKGWQNSVAKQYNISGVPANFLIDPSGVIIAKNLRGDDLEKKLAELFLN